jgi:hypothetical protein
MTPKERLFVLETLYACIEYDTANSTRPLPDACKNRANALLQEYYC